MSSHRDGASSRQFVTVGIPFMNDVATLAGAIASVLCQTHRDFELVLVDDGSSDGSTNLASSIRDPRVTLLVDGQNKGLPARLNQIADVASGDVVFRMDADDLMSPVRLERQLAFLRERSDVDVVGSAAYVIDADNKASGVVRGASGVISPVALLQPGAIIHPSVAMRKAWALRNRYDESLRRGQDIELWVRAASQTVYANQPEPLLYYRFVGQFDLRKYRAQKAVDKYVSQRFGPALLSSRELLRHNVARRAKTVLFEAAECLGVADSVRSVVSRSSAQKLADSDERRIATEMATVRMCQDSLRLPAGFSSWKSVDV